MAHSVATSYDADRPSPSPPTPAQERACDYLHCLGFRTGLALVTSKSGDSSNTVSVQIKGLLAVGTTHDDEEPLTTTRLAGSLSPAVKKSSGHFFLSFILWLICTLVIILRDRRKVKLCGPG